MRHYSGGTADLRRFIGNHLATRQDGFAKSTPQVSEICFGGDPPPIDSQVPKLVGGPRESRSEGNNRPLGHFPEPRSVEGPASRDALCCNWSWVHGATLL